ncbi:MAG: hypothetical protein FWG50_00750 [Kiritimatiellaeota bacterium]|nr:hypothetical protein [Kiritimatiellota bacterium]
MKRLISVCCVSLPLLGLAQTAQVHIAGSDYPVVFADMNLTGNVKQRIVAEMTTAFSLGYPFDDLKGQEIETGVFQLNEDTAIFWEEQKAVSLADKGNGKSIQVGKALSDKYLQAFAWMDTHSNTVQKAQAFVATLNSPDLLSKPFPVLLGMLHFDPLSDMEENDPPSDFKIRGMFQKDFHPYKYLGVTVSSFYFKPVPELGGKEIPLLLLFAVDKSGPVPPATVCPLPIGFYKGKWGFGNFPAPFNIP